MKIAKLFLSLIAGIVDLVTIPLFKRILLAGNPFKFVVIPSELDNYTVTEAFQLNFNNRFMTDYGELLTAEEVIEHDKASTMITYNTGPFEGKGVFLKIWNLEAKEGFVEFEISGGEGAIDPDEIFNSWVDYWGISQPDIVRKNYILPISFSQNRYKIGVFVAEKPYTFFRLRTVGFYGNIDSTIFKNVTVFTIKHKKYFSKKAKNNK